MKRMLVAILALGLIAGTPAHAQRRGGFLAQLFGAGQHSRSAPAVPAPRRRHNRALQTALNFFEFDAGRVDGIMGRQSRAAVRAFQAFMGEETTGTLTAGQAQLLLSAHDRLARQDDALALRISLGLAAPRDLLRAYANGEIAAAPAPATSGAPASMRALCVNIGAAGPQDLLKAQFCNLRQLSIGQMEFLMATSLNGQSPAPVFDECRAFTVDMHPQTALVSDRDAAAVVADMAQWIQRSAVPKAKLAPMAQTCLGAAYKQDDPEAALAALLVLAGLRDAIYTELIGYHLALRLNDTGSDFARARGWMEAAVAAQTDAEVSLTAQTRDARLAVLADVIRILSAK